MDIAKYIGLYLLKNQFCYIHGLGNMEVKKRPATADAKALNAPSYEVIITPGGSIDDNLANFIATNEQISISKAANALREYSIQTRKDLAEGKMVPIPNIGNFAEQNGKVRFVTDENFRYTPPGVPTIRNSKQLEEKNATPLHKPSYPPPSKADSVNWSMVILAAVLLIIIGGGIYGIYYYMNHKSSSAVATETVTQDTILAPQTQPMPAAIDTARRDSAALATNTVTPLPGAANGDSLQLTSYRMVIGNYHTRARAEKRVQNLALDGNKMEMMQKDSTNFMVLTTIRCRSRDTTHVKDSLRRMFGFNGVMILK